MGIPVLVLGDSGSGKTASLRNFEQNEVLILNVASKPLPFRKKLSTVDKANYSTIERELRAGKSKSYIVDDSQYLMAFEMFARAKDIGYGKYTDCAVNFYNLIKFVTMTTPADTIVYFLHHTEEDENGKIKAKTQGKMLNNQLTLEGLFSIVLLAKTDGKQYYFETQSDGKTVCKSPMEMFNLRIANDLKAVDKTIRNYYEFGQIQDEVNPTPATISTAQQKRLFALANGNNDLVKICLEKNGYQSTKEITLDKYRQISEQIELLYKQYTEQQMQDCEVANKPDESSENAVIETGEILA